MKYSMQGLNIQYPISSDLLSGLKTIETRTYPLPEKFEGKPLFFIETPGKTGNFKARIVAIITFEKSFKYKSKSEFRKDESKHLVTKGSIWDWDDKPKHGWPVKEIVILKKDHLAPSKRGYVFTSVLSIKD